MINIAVIGCGYWGPNHIRNFVQLPNSNMLKCCDKDVKRLERIKRLYPTVETTTDADDIFGDSSIDAVCIATPVFSHYKLVRAALSHNKHVLVEKPMTHSVRSAMSLISLAEKNQRVLMVGHTFEYTAAVNRIKEIIESGEIGEPLYIRSVRLNLGLFQPDINVCWDLAPHDISIINYLLDKTPASVNCQGQCHFTKGIEDVTNMTLNYDDGVIAFVASSWLDPNKIRKTIIVGSKKMLVYNDIEPQEKIKIFDKGVDAPPYYDTFGDFAFSYRYGDILSPRVEEYEPLKEQNRHFLECIEGAKKPKSDGRSGLKVVSILEAASRSLSQDGRAVPVFLPNDHQPSLPIIKTAVA